jgi:tetratricopeptide (TPR) repeat protein
MKFKRQSLVSQGTLTRLLNTAEEARNRRDFQQSIEILERASRLDPANVQILLNLGYAYGSHYDYAAAERCFERAIRLAPQKTEALAGAAFRARDFGNHKMAGHYYRLAMEQKDVLPEALVALAEICERERRLEDAAQLIERALRLKPDFFPALLVRARLERQTGQSGEAEKLLRSLLLSKAEPAIHAQGWYELGGLLDRQKCYDEAMSAILEAKALLSPNAGPHVAELKIVRARVEKMKAGISTEMLQRWLDCAPALPPPRRLALLGGHPRSGTTLLEQVLDSHPDIISLEETTIFHDNAYLPLTRGLPEDTPMLSVLEAASTEALRQSRADYFRSAQMFLGHPIGHRLLIDKNPSLTFLIPLLVRVFPEIKLLVALRDPRDVVLSCFMQNLPLNQGSSPYLNLESTVEEYVTMMGLWQTLAPMLKGRYLEVRYEDMVTDLEAMARRALDFLGAPWDARVLGFDEHARQKMVRSPTYADVTQPVYKRAVGRWKNYQKYLDPHLPKLEPFIKAYGYG